MSVLLSENAALFTRLMKIHSNPPILYYGFKMAPALKIKEKKMWYMPRYTNVVGVTLVTDLLYSKVIASWYSMSDQKSVWMGHSSASFQSTVYKRVHVIN